MDRQQLKDALAWQIAIGADVALLDKPPTNHASMPISRWLKTPMPDSQATPPLPELRETIADMPLVTQVASSVPAANIPPMTTNSSGRDFVQHELAHIKTLDALKNALQAFDGCALKHTASNLVFADGNPDAEIMLIGEAPGRDEDRVGLPFVGAAGQLLDKMLRAIGLDRTSVYICNILPWRPPGNRTPTVEETQMLWPFLRRHIQLKSPRIIFALGGSSAKLLLDETTGILKLRGRIVERDFGLEAPVPVLPSLHPAYLLRSPGQKRLSYQDLLQLQRFIGDKA